MAGIGSFPAAFDDNRDSDAQYEIYRDPLSTTDYAVNATPLAPEYTANLALQYRCSMGSGHGPAGPINFFARAEIQTIGPFYWNDANTLKQEAYELVNLRTGIESGRWDIALWAKNLFDTGYEAVAFEFTEANPLVQAGDPRTFGASVSA
jgi:iron complex outermembrane receptor protein